MTGYHTSPWSYRPLTEPVPPRNLLRELTPPQASWRSTQALAARELRYLDARDTVLELETDMRSVTADGRLRLDADVTGPAVRLCFTSRWGALAFTSASWRAVPDLAWRYNVRFLALTLESLRKVDRYGIALRGEQYAGWRIGPPGVQAAAAQLAAIAGMGRDCAGDVSRELSAFHAVYRRAAAVAHPDHGGDIRTWVQLQRARSILADHFGETL